MALAALCALAAAGRPVPVQAQLHTSPVPRGIDREVVVAAPPGGSALIYTVGLRGQADPTKLDRIDIQISPLAAPLAAGLAQADFVQLRLIESANQTLGDGDDVLLNTVPAGAINVSGGTTAVGDGGNATMLSSQLPKEFRFRMYYIVADLPAAAVSGHAFRLGAVANHVTTSTPDAIGKAIGADNRDRVVVNQLVPAISVAPAALAFGSLLVGTSSALPLTVSNTGANDLAVTSVTSTNGQFVRDIASFTLPPGGSQVVNVTFTPAAPGVQAASLNLTHNAPTAGTVTSVPLTGTGLAPTIGVAPVSLAYGSVLLNTPSSLTFTVTNTGTADLTVSSITSSNGEFVPSPTSFTVAPGGSRVVSVAFTPTVLGARAGSLSIVHNDALTGSPSTVALSGTGINPVIGVTPPALAFGSVQVGVSSSLPLTVRNTGTSSLVVTGVASDNPRFSPDLTSFTVAAGGTQVVNVTFTPTVGGGEAGTLTLTHNAAGGTSAVGLSGIGVAAAISLSPASLAFGNVALGANASLALTVSNPGTALLVVVSTASSDGQYVADQDGFSVAAGGSLVVNVTFTPTASGAQPATLTFTHNAAGSPTSVPLSGTGTSPSLSLSPASLAFGPVTVGSSSSLALTIFNTGGAPLDVTSVTSSDGQFTPDATNFTIAAGGNSTVNVTFAPSGAGAQTATLTVVHNAVGSPATVPLSGTGTVPLISVAPGSLAFGNVVVGAAASLLLTVTNDGDANLSVSGTSADDAFFAATPTGYTVAPGASRTVTVTFTPSATGARAATLSIAHNAAGSPTTVALTGTGTAPGFAVAPGSLDFGSVARGSSNTLSVTVSNPGTATLNVTSVSGSNGQFVPDIAAFALVPGGTQDVNVTFSPNADGLRPGVLTLVHNAAGSPSTVTLSGTGTSPGFSLSPTSLAFGSVPLGSSDVLVLTVANPGNLALTVSNIASSNGQFVTDLSSFTVAAGGSQAVNVTFSATALGLRNATLTITHDALGSPGYVSLSGTGVTAGISVAPGALVFGNVVYGHPTSLTLTVRNTGGAVLNVHDISASDPEYTATPDAFALAPGAAQTVTVTFAASVMGSRPGVLNISHDAAGLYTSIPVTGDATVPVDYLSLNFGTVNSASDSTLSLTVSNPSLNLVTIASVVSDNPVFSPDLTNFAIPAGGSQVINITFLPPKPGIYTGTLRITHNPTVSISLWGRAPGSTVEGETSAGSRPVVVVPFGGHALLVLAVGLYGLLRGDGPRIRRKPR
ncbi:MAG: choice-of-anchor D domain-containing protein [Gemmatimonadota bacterium]